KSGAGRCGRPQWRRDRGAAPPRGARGRGWFACVAPPRDSCVAYLNGAGRAGAAVSTAAHARPEAGTMPGYETQDERELDLRRAAALAMVDERGHRGGAVRR